MTQNDVIELLSSISIGTIIAWIVATAIGVCFIKLYKLFEKTHIVKEENNDLKQMVKDHDEAMKEIRQELSDIKETLAEQDKTTLKSMRHDIIKTAESAIVRGTISIREYRSLYELYEDYHDERHGNGYVTSLMKKLDCNVRIIGKLDEHGEDINDD